ncbi:uncharacterized protein PG986_014642 [Apiospora aurea]|uniref:Uncharacterized protein n=1 Tax=Apiospora aurea TaxID=335848 RepID=A0ABR1PTK0_9PEZI
MNANNAPEVVWDHTRDPEPYIPICSPQTWQLRQPQRIPEQQQQCTHNLPASQAAYPETSQQSPNGYVEGESTSSGSGVDGMGRNPKRDATICGISRTLFITLVVVTIVIIAAAVGGGVGGVWPSRASGERPAGDVSASSTDAVTAASRTDRTTGTSLYAVPTAGVRLPLECARLTGENVTVKYDSSYEASFSLACGLDKPGRRFDIVGATVYTYNDCMRLCVSYNRASRTKDCRGVLFGADGSSLRKHHTPETLNPPRQPNHLTMAKFSLLGFFLCALMAMLARGNEDAWSSKCYDGAAIINNRVLKAYCKTTVPMGPPWVCSKMNLNYCYGFADTPGLFAQEK